MWLDATNHSKKRQTTKVKNDVTIKRAVFCEAFG